MEFNLDGFSIEYISEDPNVIAENETAAEKTSQPADIAVVSFPNLKFDDVKHLLYSGIKFVVFDLEQEMYDSSLYKTCTYSKERFPEKVFDNAADLEEYIKKNNIKAGSAEFETIPFSEFKLNSDGLIPCIAQDYKTGEVLMMAYMNEESYNKTLETGHMTYWSSSPMPQLLRKVKRCSGRWKACSARILRSSRSALTLSGTTKATANTC